MTVQGLFVLFPGSGVSVEPDNHWGSQINQLEQLIDKLECEVCMWFKAFAVSSLCSSEAAVGTVRPVCLQRCTVVHVVTEDHFFKVCSGAINTPW